MSDELIMHLDSRHLETGEMSQVEHDWWAERVRLTLGLAEDADVTLVGWRFAGKPRIGWNPKWTYTSDPRPLDITKTGDIYVNGGPREGIRTS